MDEKQRQEAIYKVLVAEFERVHSPDYHPNRYFIGTPKVDVPAPPTPSQPPKDKEIGR
jgi:hypothetical protein